MNELLQLFLALLLGAAAGVLFFGGLWWTVRQVTEARRGVWLIPASYCVRLAIVAAVFLVCFRDHAGQLAVALGGFLAARAAFIRWLPTRTTAATGQPTGARHAP